MVKEIYLNSKKYKNLVTIVDDEDYYELKDKNWRPLKTTTKLRNNFYATTDFKKSDGKWTTRSLHRLIMDEPEYPFVVDHINGDGLDNRKSNLRVISYKENAQNRVDELSDDERRKESYRMHISIKLDENIQSKLIDLVHKEKTTMSKISQIALMEYLNKNYPEIFDDTITK